MRAPAPTPVALVLGTRAAIGSRTTSDARVKREHDKSRTDPEQPHA
jgi:hypothetical protein